MINPIKDELDAYAYWLAREGMNNKEIKKLLKQQRRELRKKHACHNCRYRIWKERPRPDTCSGCVDYYSNFNNWKKRKLWQIIRDFFKYGRQL